MFIVELCHIFLKSLYFIASNDTHVNIEIILNNYINIYIYLKILCIKINVLNTFFQIFLQNC